MLTNVSLGLQLGMNVIDFAAISVSDLLITVLTAAADATYIAGNRTDDQMLDKLTFIFDDVTRGKIQGSPKLDTFCGEHGWITEQFALFVAINTISIHSLALVPLSLKFKV